MIIADPSYDTVFKFLMEDTEIARALISEIIGEQVLSLTLAPQESALVVKPFGISLYRVDFKAVVRDAKGEQRKVLIEMQKAKHLIDIMRFRRYLGDNYTRTDTVDGVEQVLPITTIYLVLL